MALVHRSPFGRHHREGGDQGWYVNCGERQIAQPRAVAHLKVWRGNRLTPRMSMTSAGRGVGARGAWHEKPYAIEHRQLLIGIFARP